MIVTASSAVADDQVIVDKNNNDNNNDSININNSNNHKQQEQEQQQQRCIIMNVDKDDSVCNKNNNNNVHNVEKDYISKENEKEIRINEYFESLRVYPTNGQQLIFVSKFSQYKIVLDDIVTYQLRYSQQIHNYNKDDLIQKPSWEYYNSYYNNMPSNLRDITKAAEKEQNDTLTMKHYAEENIILTTNQDNNNENENNNNNGNIQLNYNSDDDSNNNDNNARKTKIKTVPLLLKSHPGYAIVTLSDKLHKSGYMILGQDYYKQLGVGKYNINSNNNNNNTVVRIRLHEPDTQGHVTTNILGEPLLGKRYILETNDNLFICAGENVQYGAPITLASWDYENNNKKQRKRKDNDAITNVLEYSKRYDNENCQFVVNNDGTISNVLNRNLVIGISKYPPITLVPKNSTKSQLVFKYTKQFYLPNNNKNNNNAGVTLELTSHPGMAVVPISTIPYKSHKLYSIQELGIGPADNALQLYAIDDKVHHQFRLTTKQVDYSKDDNDDSITSINNMVLVPMDMKLQIGTPIRLFKYNTKKELNNEWTTSFLNIYSRIATRNATWIINTNDNTISPVNAPHLVLGCEYIQSSNKIIKGKDENYIDNNNEESIVSSQQDDIGRQQRQQQQQQRQLDDNNNNNNKKSSENDDYGNDDNELFRFVHKYGSIIVQNEMDRIIIFLLCAFIIMLLKDIHICIWLSLLSYFILDSKEIAYFFLGIFVMDIILKKIIIPKYINNNKINNKEHNDDEQKG